MIRTTVKPDTPSISFDIPESYIGQEIEVIAFEKSQSLNQQARRKKVVTFNAVAIDTRGYKFSREDANE